MILGGVAHGEARTPVRPTRGQTAAMTTPGTGPSGQSLTIAEGEVIAALRERHLELRALKERLDECAAQRRDAIDFLGGQGWSYRRIGELIGASGQRIDSMLRRGERREQISEP